jgi:hypothetical protein
MPRPRSRLARWRRETAAALNAKGGIMPQDRVITEDNKGEPQRR